MRLGELSGCVARNSFVLLLAVSLRSDEGTLGVRLVGSVEVSDCASGGLLTL